MLWEEPSCSFCSISEHSFLLHASAICLTQATTAEQQQLFSEAPQLQPLQHFGAFFSAPLISNLPHTEALPGEHAEVCLVVMQHSQHAHMAPLRCHVGGAVPLGVSLVWIRPAFPKKQFNHLQHCHLL